MAYEVNPLYKEGLQKKPYIPTPPTVTVDGELSTTSTNPVQNKVITSKIQEIISDGIDIDVTTLAEFVAAVQRATEVSVRIHLRDHISLTTDLEVNLDNCEIYGHDHQIRLENHIFTIKCATCYFSQTRFNASTGVTAHSCSNYNNALIKIISTQPSTRFVFEYAIFMNFINYPGVEKKIIETSTTASGTPSLHLYFMFCEVMTNYQHANISSSKWCVNNVSPTSLHALTAHMIDYWSGTNPGASKWDCTNQFSFTGAFPRGSAKLAWICDGSCKYTKAASGGIEPNAVNIYNPSYEEYTTLYDYIHGDTFATAAQGAKADTALQSIAHGTDGDYITTAVTEKDANNAQTLSASLTMQPIATADSTHQGLAEASDVKAALENAGIIWTEY